MLESIHLGRTASATFCLCVGLPLFSIGLLSGCCASEIRRDLHGYTSVNAKARYRILDENPSGFKLAVYVHTDDFYTEKRHLIAEAKNNFTVIARQICIEHKRESMSIDENNYLSDANVSCKEALVVNWVLYK